MPVVPRREVRGQCGEENIPDDGVVVGLGSVADVPCAESPQSRDGRVKLSVGGVGDHRHECAEFCHQLLSLTGQITREQRADRGRGVEQGRVEIPSERVGFDCIEVGAQRIEVRAIEGGGGRGELHRSIEAGATSGFMEMGWTFVGQVRPNAALHEKSSRAPLPPWHTFAVPFVFADVEIDLDRVEVRRGGRPVPVQPQVFDVIEYLVRHRDRVVTKEELLDNVWGDRFVSESALTSRIKSARRALGDDGATQAVIRTVHGRGYRFVAGVDGPVDRKGPAPADKGAQTTASLTDVGSMVDQVGWPLTGRAETIHRIIEVVSGSNGAVGVAIVGADRVGKSQVAAAVGDRLAADGIPVSYARGVRPDVALSALAHLVPGEILPVDSTMADGDLARTALWHRARSALDRGDDADRPVFVVDDIDRIDPMSDALLAHLAGTASIRLVVTGRATADISALMRLVESGVLTRIELGPLDEADVDTLLYRRLGGPIDLHSLQELTRLTRGAPGLLVELVDASVDAGSLRHVDGVWQLLGRPVSHRAETWPPAGLSSTARAGAERLALLDHVPLDVADEVLGTGVVDELDVAHLVALERHRDEVLIRLADPVLSDAVAASMTPLRAHRVRDEVMEAVSSVALPPSTVASVVRWDDSEGHELPVGRRTAAASEALRSGDHRSAATLIDGLDARTEPAVAVIAAELAVGRGQHALAEQLLSELDLDRLVDDHMTVSALRRRATIDAQVHGRHHVTVEHLNELAGRHDGAIRDGLLALAATLLGQIHRYDDLLSLAEVVDLDDPRARAELSIARAFAFSGKGRFHDANAALRDVDTSVADLPADLADELRDTAVVLMTTSAQQLGDLQRAVELRRRHLPAGRITRFGFAPVVAADIELSAGRPRAAREALRPVRSLQMRNVYPQFEGVVEAQSARIAVGLGDDAAARDHLDRADAAVDRSFGAARARTLAWSADARISLAMPTADHGLDEFAERSRLGAALLSESETRCVAVMADPTPAAARRHLPRVALVASEFDGDLWPIRVAHVRARADEAPLDDVVRRYRDLGYEHLARRAEQGR